MVAAALANRKQLLRLVVPKALLSQTAQSIQSRLGGLVGRGITHISFSRRTRITPEKLQLYRALHHASLQDLGIILTTPDHMLSFDLSGLQKVVDNEIGNANEMVKFQSWLATHARDILDESDFSLDVKTQLIYPSGPQVAVDGNPYRWKCAQMLLSILEDILPAIQLDFPRHIKTITGFGGYPMIHILNSTVEDEIYARMIKLISYAQTPLIRLDGSASSSISFRKSLEDVMTMKRLDSQILNITAKGLIEDSISRKSILLLLRGLLSNRILTTCVKKRWNVQYGLHPNRDPIAVPYDSKGVPSDLSEFGHPDVSIMLTCLSFYYGGVSVTQFMQGLQRVLQSNDPASEYDRWISGCNTLPYSLRYWNFVNIDDKAQISELWEHLKFHRSVLDHYMNHFVFPVHAKQFTYKIQASGWDIPLFTQLDAVNPSKSAARSTGFSGTNDNKMALPLNISQDDLPFSEHTNAEVLTYLLRPENRQCLIASKEGKRLTEHDLLQKLRVHGIRVLVDAGAYIVESDNHTLVKNWLIEDPDAKAAVFFRGDQAFVLYRGKQGTAPLLATPFAESMEGCLVYLDEAHTRGVDFKLPPFARGAVTLALGQTKDKTVQGKT